MCGLVYGVSFKNKPINRQIAEQYESQKTRGRQGFGVFDGTHNNLIRKTKEEDILKWLSRYKSTDILFHHRLPTSTDNVKNACHPFSTQEFFETNYVLIHNGSVRNAAELRKVHEKAGIQYYSIQADARFNDSEALTWDVARYLEGEQEALESYGGIAFICIAIKDGKKKVHFARNTSPLFMQVSRKRLFLASTQGIARDEVKSHTLYTFDFETKKLTQKPLYIKSYVGDLPPVPTPVVPRKKQVFTPNSYASKQADVKDESHILELPEKSLQQEITDRYANDEDEYESETPLEDRLEWDDDLVVDDAYEQNLEDGRTKEIKQVYQKYIREAKGYYWAAIKSLRRDIRKGDMTRWECNNHEQYEHMLTKVSILRSVKDMMLVDPHYAQFNSRHPNYASQQASLDLLELAKKGD